MNSDSSEPLEGVDPDAVAPGAVDAAELRAGLAADSPLVRQRAVAVCDALADADPAAVAPVLDAVATAVADGNSAIALRAIAVFDTVAGHDPGALEGYLDPLVDRADDDIVDVQLTAATALAKVVVARPDLVAPSLDRLIGGVRATAIDDTPEGFGEYVRDEATRQTLREHQQGERDRRTSARRTLINVVVAVLESEAAAAVDRVDDLAGLLNDDDPAVAGGAVDGIGEIAAVDPAAVRPVRDRLIACLDHEHTVVRARAVRALGHLGDDEAVPALRRTADGDDNEDVREVAAETAAFLAGGE
ncbi:HEAT repeat domain-containing protein [Halobaculum lipolyticum]|uniref:HEAT repeat domain-containing protein n=1 Tax=Halobaculum lipolyticum TaxID=3032001 RepID=A0ABD5W5X2_9EURY|nr:HEAT repeat domain-containing protein [Halobaculum sp. DT31]